MHKPNIVRTFILDSEGAGASEPEGTPENTSPISSVSTWETEAQGGKGLGQGHTAGAWKTGRGFSVGCDPSWLCDP